jgi:hypothetical protein
MKDHLPGTVAERSKAWIVFARSDGMIVGLNPTRAWMSGVCVSFVLCLGSGLATSWSLVQGALHIVNRLGNWKEARTHKCCRAFEKLKRPLISMSSCPASLSGGPADKCWDNIYADFLRNHTALYDNIRLSLLTDNWTNWQRVGTNLLTTNCM